MTRNEKKRLFPDAVSFATPAQFARLEKSKILTACTVWRRCDFGCGGGAEFSPAPLDCGAGWEKIGVAYIKTSSAWARPGVSVERLAGDLAIAVYEMRQRGELALASRRG